jgi:hypothetical protein
VKKQRGFEIKMVKGLSLKQMKFLEGDEINQRKYGCVLPPSLAAMPDVLHETFEFAKTDKLDNVKEDIHQCLGILLSSYHPWSAQYSSTPHQHHIGVAISTMQLFKDKHIYRYYLGENIVWNLYSKILGLLQRFSPSFQPWHGTSSADRISNAVQVVLHESLRHETIGPLLGATMAQRTAAINERYRVGLRQVDKAVQDMAIYKHEDKDYISYDVNLKLRELYQVCYSSIFTNFVNIAMVT